MEFFEITVDTGDDSILFFAGLSELEDALYDTSNVAISRQVKVLAVSEGTALIDGSCAVRIDAPIGVVTSQFLLDIIYAVQHPSHVLTHCIASKYREPHARLVVGEWHPDEIKYARFAGLRISDDKDLKVTKIADMRDIAYKVSCKGSEERMQYRVVDIETDLSLFDSLLHPSLLKIEDGQCALALLNPYFDGPEELVHQLPTMEVTRQHIKHQCEVDLKIVSVEEPYMLYYSLPPPPPLTIEED